MNHPKDEQILKYVGYQLAGRELTALEQHLSVCARCRAEVAIYRAMDETICDAPGPEWQPQPLLAEVSRQIREERAFKPRPRLTWRWATMAAALALALGVTLYSENAHYWHELEQENKSLFAEHYTYVAEPNVQPVSLVVQR